MKRKDVEKLEIAKVDYMQTEQKSKGKKIMLLNQVSPQGSKCHHPTASLMNIHPTGMPTIVLRQAEQIV